MNIFFVSSVGQVHSAQAVIKKKELVNNIIVILYTPTNMDIYNNIRGNIKQREFIKIIDAQLPLNPNRFKRRTQRRIHKTYEKIFEENDIQEIFIANTNSHYNYLCKVAKNRNCVINLFEEGAGTYKVLLSDNEEVEVLSTKQQLNQLKIFANDRLAKIITESFIIKDFIPFLKKLTLVKLLVLCKSIIKEVIVIAIGKERIDSLKLKLVPKEIQSFFSEWTEFDNAYLMFPEIAEKSKKYHFANVEKLKVNHTLTPELQEIIDTDNVINLIDNESVVFVDQLYGGKQIEVVRETLDTLHRNFQGKNIFIKLHPKASYARWRRFNAQMKEYEGVNFHILKFAQSFPIEVLLEEKKFKYLVGISSTSLLYAKEYYEQVEIFSIAKSLYMAIPTMRKNLMEDYELIESLGIIKFNDIN